MQTMLEHFLIHIEYMCYSSTHPLPLHGVHVFQPGGMEVPWSTSVGPAGSECTRLQPAGKLWQRSHVKVSGSVENTPHTAEEQPSHSAKLSHTIRGVVEPGHAGALP